eukprot:c36547_g1_i1 orf=1-207(-)
MVPPLKKLIMLNNMGKSIPLGPPEAQDIIGENKRERSFFTTNDKGKCPNLLSMNEAARESRFSLSLSLL